jgi:hypothetical protein
VPTVCYCVGVLCAGCGLYLGLVRVQRRPEGLIEVNRLRETQARARQTEMQNSERDRNSDEETKKQF